jgi:hypothetical protein
MKKQSSPSRQKQIVEFNRVTLYEFPMVLGDNPACSNGIPVQIDWKPQNISCRNFELFDAKRESVKQGRAMRLKDRYRAQLLLKSGYTMDRLVKATMEVEEIRESRRESLKQQGWGKFVETLEGTGQLPVYAMKGVLGATGGIVAATGGMLVAGGAAVVNGSAIGARTVVNTGAAVVGTSSRVMVNTGAAVVNTGAAVMNTGAGMFTSTVTTTGDVLMATGKTIAKAIYPLPK